MTKNRGDRRNDLRGAGTSSVSHRVSALSTDEDLHQIAEEIFTALMAESDREAKHAVPSACRGCGSKDLVPIVYGLPIRALFEAEAEGRIILGGPLTKRGAPTVACRGCGVRAGSRAD